MALVFDSLGYSRKLRDSGVPQEQAEAMADAAHQYIMLELVTTQELQRECAAIREELQRETVAIREELQRECAAIRHELQEDAARLRHEIDNLALRLTVRLGAMLAGGIAFLAAFIKLV